MGNGDNRCYIPYIVISCLFYALPSFARRKHFATYFIDVISHFMHHNPDPSPKPVAGDESGIIKLSIFIGCYFYLSELASTNITYIK